MKKLAINRHHLIQQCEREYYNVHDRRNIQPMLVIQHNALHQLFWNLTTPKDQLKSLQELFGPILSNHAKNLLSELTNMSDDEFYDVGLIK